MPLSSHAMDSLALYERVSKALGRQPRESIENAAKRIMETPHGDRRWRVAREVLHGRGDGWAKLRRAAKVADRSGV